MWHASEKGDGLARFTRCEIRVGCCQCELLREPECSRAATKPRSLLELTQSGSGTVGHHRQPYLRQQLGCCEQRVMLVSTQAEGVIQPLLGLLDLAPLCVHQDGGELSEPDADFSGVRSASRQHGR